MVGSSAAIKSAVPSGRSRLALFAQRQERNNDQKEEKYAPSSVRRHCSSIAPDIRAPSSQRLVRRLLPQLLLEGSPVAPARLARAMHEIPELEYDEQGNMVGRRVTLCWLHGISAEQIDSLPLQLSCALTTGCTLSHAWGKHLCPPRQQLTDHEAHVYLFISFIKENDKNLPA